MHRRLLASGRLGRAGSRLPKSPEFSYKLIVNESAFHPEDKAVSKVRDKAIPEPLKKPPFDAEAWFGRLDELGGRDFLPEGMPDEPPAEPDRARLLRRVI